MTIKPPDSNGLTLSWSSALTNFTLLTNSDLTSTNWIPVGTSISITNGTNQSITVPPPTSGNLFFRLKQ
ncbi:MAG TPA: hypothetical protein VN516_06425 [Candidatus Baltobacteraceae bacterium]|nr:hypothetical protein [Candidatus Baltobacteraceae bacterium]